MENYAFRGLESNGLLLHGDLPLQRASALAGMELDFVTVPSSTQRVRCALLVVRIERLSTWGIPLLRWTYPEAVWLLALQNQSYLAVKAHTPLYMLGALSLMDKYNTDRGAMHLLKESNRATVAVRAGGADMTLALHGNVEGNTDLIGNLWTRSRGGNYYRIPWGDNAPQSVTRMHCRLRGISLGERVFGRDVRWDNEAIYFQDRPHRCAPAYAEQPLGYYAQSG